MALLDFGPFGTLAPDDPYQLALMMKQMQDQNTERIPFPPDPETGLSPLSGQVITPPIYTGPMTEELSGKRIPFESVPKNPVTRVDFESNLPKNNNLTRPNQTQKIPETVPQTRVPEKKVVQPVTPPRQADPLADYNAVMNREPGFFQENAPLILGLLGGVSGLLEASGPSRVPVSGGQIFARGLQSGLKGYMGGLDYQKGMKKARQEEAGNILDAVAWREKFQNAELKRQQRVNLGNSILEGLQRLDMDTLTPDMKWKAKLAETLVNSGSIESAWQVFSKIAASPEAQPSLMKMDKDDTLLQVSPGGQVEEIWKDEAVEEPATPRQSFMTGKEVLELFPNLSGSIDSSQNYRPEYNDQGEIIDFKEFDLTEETPPTAELMEDVAKGEGAVAKRYRNEAKDYFSIADSFKKVKAAAMEESPAGDIALIFAYMKMLDPGSVVREGEFATAQNTGSVSERVYVLYNKLLKGDRLTTSQRQMFMKSANTVLESQRDRSENLMNFYTKISNDYGYKVDRVVRDPFEGIEQIIIQGTEPPPVDPFKRKSPQKLKFGEAVR